MVLPLKVKRCILLFFLFFTHVFNVCHAEEIPGITLSSENAGWTAVVSGKAVCRPKNTSYGFAVLTDGRMISACTENGKILWQRSVPGRPEPYLSVFENDFILTVSSRRTLHLMNPGGLLLWSKNVPFSITDNPYTGRDGRIFVRGRKALACYGIKGICKWILETPVQNSNIPIMELNDGTLLVFLENTADGKSTAIRVTPFGETVESITFSGFAVNAASCSDGVLLVFSGGGAGLCTVKDKTTVTKWVIPSENPVFAGMQADSNAVFIPVNSSTTVLVLPYAGASCAVVFKTSEGEILTSFQIKEINAGKLSASAPVSASDAFFLSDQRTCALYGINGRCLWTADLPPAKNLSFVSYTNDNHVILCETSWVITGYRTIQKLSGAGRRQNKKSDYNNFYTINTQYYDAFPFSHELDETVTDPKRTELLRKGLYGKKEQEWASILMSACRAYSRSLSQNFSGARPENLSVFRQDSIGVEIMISQLPLFGTKDFSQIIAELLRKEKDKTRQKLLLKAAEECAFDPDSSILNAIDSVLFSIPAQETMVLTSLCDAVYAICRFMGRPALYSHGIKILTQLAYPQYDSRVREYSHETLKKISELKI